MNQFETLRQDLHENYGHEYTAAEIDAKLDEVIAKHTKKAELEEFVPLLVEREVREYFGAHRLHGHQDLGYSCCGYRGAGTRIGR